MPTCAWSDDTGATMLRQLARQNLQSHPPGTRVRSTLDGRLALIYASPERARAGLVLVPVMVEGSTRRELWATHCTEILPSAEQFAGLGGRKRAPAGYPLIPMPR